ncbi:MAG: DUF1080 domain-containing protein, partial [Acidobacteriia bacterium]|nr:DUF1080 domain-containing protein [Terriglobia bacterium]
LYWYRGNDISIFRIMVRTASSIAGLASAADVELLLSNTPLAAPNMMFYDNTYFLSTEYLETVWKTRIYSGQSPTGPFSELPGNPILTDGSACLFQTPVGSTLYAYYAKSTSGTWTLELRQADLTLGRKHYGVVDASKWTASGGSWSAPDSIQQNGTMGTVAQAITADREILRSSYSGSDFVLEGFGKQGAGRIWGLGIRTTDLQNTYTLNLYEDLDGTNNLHFYRWANGNPLATELWTTAVGPISLNAWYKLKIKVQGNSFAIYFNDTLKTPTPISDSQFSSGAVALYGEAGTVAQFNDVRVRKYATIDPVTQVGSEENRVRVAIRAMLQGPFNTAAGADSMNKTTTWKTTLTNHFVGRAIPALAIDSVTIEVRDSVQYSSPAKRGLMAPAWILTNGTILSFLDTTRNYVQIDTVPGSYYVVVRHRNHLAVMSANRLVLSATATLYDFTTGQSQAYGTNPMIQPRTGGRFCLYAGDATGDLQVNAVDNAATWNGRNMMDYLSADVTLDGQINAGDNGVTWNNRNKTTQVP